MKDEYASLANNQGEVLRTFNKGVADRYQRAEARRTNRKVTRTASLYRTPSGGQAVEHTVVSRKVKANKEDHAQPTLAQPIRFGIRPYDLDTEHARAKWARHLASPNAK